MFVVPCWLMWTKDQDRNIFHLPTNGLKCSQITAGSESGFKDIMLKVTGLIFAPAACQSESALSPAEEPGRRVKASLDSSPLTYRNHVRNRGDHFHLILSDPQWTGEQFIAIHHAAVVRLKVIQRSMRSACVDTQSASRSHVHTESVSVTVITRHILCDLVIPSSSHLGFLLFCGVKFNVCTSKDLKMSIFSVKMAESSSKVKPKHVKRPPGGWIRWR